MGTLDHLVVAAADLAEGRRWVEARVGVAMDDGGRHATFGTHNAVLSLGPDHYLEVIAVDPDAPPPTRPRWFDLDTDAMRRRLARGPALVHWVARVGSVVEVAEVADPLELSRGPNRWVIGVAPDGSMPLGGLAPSRILWRTPPPSTSLPDKGVRLDVLTLRTSGTDDLHAAVDDVTGPVDVRQGPVGLTARLSTPAGPVVLGG